MDGGLGVVSGTNSGKQSFDFKMQSTPRLIRAQATSTSRRGQLHPKRDRSLRFTTGAQNKCREIHVFEKYVTLCKGDGHQSCTAYLARNGELIRLLV